MRSITRQGAAGVLAGLATVLSVAGCDRRHDGPVAQPADATVASNRSGAESDRPVVADRSESLAGTIRRSSDRPPDAAGGEVDDGRITAGVNAELAKDPQLSALAIDVRTREGRVVLEGSAPDAESRLRATEIARSVPGVSAVDNRLQLGG